MIYRKLEKFARRLPLGRRILLTVGLYVVAVAALGIASWHMVSVVTDYRHAINTLQTQTGHIAELAKSTARFQAKVREHMEVTNEDDVSEIQDVFYNLSQLINTLEAIENKDIVEKERLLVATRQYYQQSAYIRDVNARLREQYQAIVRNSASVTGLIRILARPIDSETADQALSTAVMASVRRIEEAFARALINMNAYYFSGDKAKADLALGELTTMKRMVPVISSMLNVPMLKSAVEALNGKTENLAIIIEELDGLFLHRANLMNNDLVESQSTMTQAIDALSLNARNIQALSTVQLEERLRQTLMNILIMTVGFLVVGLIANFIIVGSIRRPILELCTVMEDLSGGDWERHVPGQSEKDEVGAMARTLEVFKSNTIRMHNLETEKREALALEKQETEKALQQLDVAHKEIQVLANNLSNENLRLGAELDVSKKLQEMLLPREDELTSVVGLDIATFMEPANEVGGDYFDVLNQNNGKVHIGIGDVTGHGLESGVVMLMTQSMMRTLTNLKETDLPVLLDMLNTSLFSNLARLGGDKNLTLSLIEYQPVREDGLPGGTLRIVGQHESVLIVRANGELEEIDTLYLGMPIGLIDNMKEFIDETVVLLNPDDTVIMYTDGITEAANPEGGLYGMERLKEVCTSTYRLGVKDIQKSIIEDVMAFASGQELYDDISLIVLKQTDLVKAAA